MKCLSLHQPWASAMALGLKKNETRSWKTFYRGPLLIHAAKKAIGWPSIDIQGLFDGITFQPFDLPLGVILCRVDLVDCQKIFLHNRPGGIERILGNYTPGRYMWITKNLVTFDPILYQGRQRIFNVPDSIILSNMKKITKSSHPII